MDVKEFFKSMLYRYFIIVTFINIAMFALGIIFRPDQQFGYEAYLFPLIYGLISMIPIALANFSKNEMSVKRTLVKELIELLALEACLLAFAFGENVLDSENLSLVVGFALSVLVIYLLVNLVTWFLDYRQAKKMTDDLMAFQNHFSE